MDAPNGSHEVFLPNEMSKDTDYRHSKERKTLVVLMLPRHTVQGPPLFMLPLGREGEPLMGILHNLQRVPTGGGCIERKEKNSILSEGGRPGPCDQHTGEKAFSLQKRPARDPGNE